MLERSATCRLANTSLSKVVVLTTVVIVFSVLGVSFWTCSSFLASAEPSASQAIVGNWETDMFEEAPLLAAIYLWPLIVIGSMIILNVVLAPPLAS
mmetsp:Transcript_14439/g.47409  ORF Transcript_14439/g.47409 Transcript_14439/m.47409 type:complete len:96 (+) Transcript_14439:851-1138(+)